MLLLCLGLINTNSLSCSLRRAVLRLQCMECVKYRTLGKRPNKPRYDVTLARRFLRVKQVTACEQTLYVLWWLTVLVMAVSSRTAPYG